MKKLDIMNRKEPGKWIIQGGKVQRIEEFIPTALIVEKEENEKVEEIVKGAKAIVDGKELRYDEVKEEWKREKKTKKKKK